MTTFYLDQEGGDDLFSDLSIERAVPFSIQNAVRVASPVKFGAGSLSLIDAASNGNTALYINTNYDEFKYSFFASLFTVDAWVNWSSHGAVNESILGTWNFSNSGSRSWSLCATAAGNLAFLYSTDGTTILEVSAAYTPPLNTWVHIAVDRDAANVVRLYVNGAVLASATVASAFLSVNAPFRLGNDEGNVSRFKGYLDSVRITRGVARYAGAFSVPTTEFPNSYATDQYWAYVKLLLRFDGDGTGTSFANRWRSATNGATTTRIAPGDTIRLMASPEPTLLGNATWTNLSKNVTLPATVTAVVNNCDSNWVASTNATCSLNTSSYKQGTSAVGIAIVDAFTTGLVAYFATKGVPIRSISNRASNLLGAGTLTLIQNAHADDANISVALPFTVSFEGANYTTVYVGSNGYLTFGAGSSEFSGLSASNPPLPGFHVNADDRSYQRVYAGSEDANATFRIRYEGTASGSTNAPGSSTVFWEVTFTAATPGDIKIDMGANAASGSGTSGVTDGAVYTATFANGTLNTGYTFNSSLAAPVAMNLSGYQQLSFWLSCNSTIYSGDYSLRLCSDSYGAVTVNKIPIPGHTGANFWAALTVDTKVPLGSSILSIALYQDRDISARTLRLDHLIACQASTAPDSLTLTSLLGKEWNLGWSGSTSYGLNVKRRPSQANRNGFQYRVTTAGVSAATEPVWPQGYTLSVSDGSVVWVCEELEDSWFGIKSISGTTVLLDNAADTSGSQGRGYAGSSETVATYKREAVRIRVSEAYDSTVAAMQSQKAGTPGNPITYSGGWDRATMTLLDGESWQDLGNSWGAHLSVNHAFSVVRNLNSTRASRAVATQNAQLTGLEFYNIHGNNGEGALSLAGYGTGTFVQNIHGSNNTGTSFYAIEAVLTGLAVTSNSSFSDYGASVFIGPQKTRLNFVVIKNNRIYNSALASTTSTGADVVVSNLITANNTADSGVIGFGRGGLTLINPQIAEATPLQPMTTYAMRYNFLQSFGKVSTDNRIVSGLGSIQSVIDQRHTPSGLAWRFSPTNTYITYWNPLRLSVGKIACAANTTVNVTIWTYRDSTNIKGRLVLASGQIAPLDTDIFVLCEPALNTWTQSSTLSFTPNVAGVVEIMFEVSDGVGTTNNYWIDDVTVS